jgi:hypothetical protein
VKIAKIRVRNIGLSRAPAALKGHLVTNASQFNKSGKRNLELLEKFRYQEIAAPCGLKALRKPLVQAIASSLPDFSRNPSSFDMRNIDSGFSELPLHDPRDARAVNR